MTQNRIRPIAICVFQHQNRILVFEAYDHVKDEIFYRPLGGSIEFGEHSSIAVAREIKEELGAEICNLSFLGSIENEAEFVDPEFYQRESLDAFEDDGSKMKVVWKDIEFFKNGKAPLYPTGLFELLEKR
jgi:8-oxo-dGTP pyrophosphatase MutT (NUDIX family)